MKNRLFKISHAQENMYTCLIWKDFSKSQNFDLEMFIVAIEQTRSLGRKKAITAGLWKPGEIHQEDYPSVFCFNRELRVREEKRRLPFSLFDLEISFSLVDSQKSIK